MSKVILISQKPLPFNKIGSWTTMYKNYFESGKSEIDVILCEEPDLKFNDVEYCIVPTNIMSKVRKRLSKNNYLLYIESLFNFIKPNESYIIQIVDNFGLVKALSVYLKEHPSLRERLYIQFFYHGYPPFYGNFESRWFFEFINEMVLLTFASYKAHKEAYINLPCMFSVVHNGIDTNKFYKPTKSQKKNLKSKHQVEDKTVFVWCSQDRPKKGLDLILNVWKKLINQYTNIELWVIGANRETDIKGVKFLGKIKNDDLPEYYQTADCYLFPTLCQEGFGMSLIEALHCGNYCIASDLGGVVEVLKNGELGVLIKNPHFIEEWISEIKDFLGDKKKKIHQVNDVYSKENWINRINEVIANAKQLMR